MKILLYLFIFLLKVLENALSTLRLIVVANGKRQVGAILNFLISIVWVLTTGYVVIDVLKDPFKIVVFGLGSYFGSLVGSIMEEKIALGSNMLMIITEEDIGECMVQNLQKQDFAVTTFKGKGNERFRKVLMIMVQRKRKKEVIDIVRNCDEKAMIIIENAYALNGYMKK